MGLFSLLALLGLMAVALLGENAGSVPFTLPTVESDPGFEWTAMCQSIAAAVMLVTSLRLARGRSRRN